MRVRLPSAVMRSSVRSSGTSSWGLIVVIAGVLLVATSCTETPVPSTATSGGSTTTVTETTTSVTGADASGSEVTLIRVPARRSGPCAEYTPPAAIRLGISPARLSVGDGFAWVSDWERGSLVEVDLHRLCIRATVDVGAPRSSVIDMLAVGDAVWVADFSTSTLIEFGDQGTIMARVDGVRAGGGMVATPDGLFVACCGIDSGGDEPITRVDIGSLSASTVAEIGWPSGIGYGHGSLWVGSTVSEQLSRIDPSNGEVTASIDVGSLVTDIEVTGDSVWVAVESIPALVRVDPLSNAVVSTIPLTAKPGYPIHIAATSDGGIWVAGKGLSPTLVYSPTGARARILPPLSVNAMDIHDSLLVLVTDTGLLVVLGETP